MLNSLKKVITLVSR